MLSAAPGLVEAKEDLCDQGLFSGHPMGAGEL
jgi:hypothetical protein